MIAIVAGITLSIRVGCMETRVLLSQELSDRPTQCDEPTNAMSFSARPVDILDAGEVRATIGTWDRRAYLELCLWGS